MDVGETMNQMRDAMNVRRVFGEPYKEGDVTIIPVARVRGGGGGGTGEKQGRGGGFGLVAAPAGVYVVKGGAVSWRPAVDVNRIIFGCQVVAVIWALVVASSTVR